MMYKKGPEGMEPYLVSEAVSDCVSDLERGATKVTRKATWGPKDVGVVAYWVGAVARIDIKGLRERV